MSQNCLSDLLNRVGGLDTTFLLFSYCYNYPLTATTPEVLPTALSPCNEDSGEDDSLNRDCHDPFFHSQFQSFSL